MQDLSYLSTLDKPSFEAERNRLIAAEILKAPPERRPALVALQMELDQIRDRSTPEQFMQVCLSRATENMENLADQLMVVKELVSEPPPIRPPAER